MKIEKFSLILNHLSSEVQKKYIIFEGLSYEI